MSDWVGLFLANGRYQVIAGLPRGGVKDVYRAWDHAGETEVIVKAPRPELGAKTGPGDWLAGAVRPLLSLGHPHLVRVLDVGEHAGVPFVVVEKIDGASLRARQPLDLDNVPLPMSFLETADWLEHVADALDYLHSQHYVHRAIEPAHILFDRWDRVFVGDCCFPQALAPIGLSGESAGPPEYRPPEIQKGLPCDGRADQYALAAMVYEMLTGHCPYDGTTPAAVLVERARQQPVRHPRRPALPRAVAQALIKALAEKPANRFPSCKAFADAVIAAMSPKGKTRKPDPAPLPRGLRLLLLAAVSVVLVAGLGLATLIAYDTIRGRLERDSQADGSNGSDKDATGSRAKKINLRGKPGVVISSNGGKRYSSIRAALQEARPGTRLTVSPGVYAESLVLTQRVEIVGEGAREDIVLDSLDAPCITLRAPGAMVRGLTLRSQAGDETEPFPTVDAGSGQLVLEDCDIGSFSLACVAVRGVGATPILRRCLISGKGAGIIFSGGSRGTLEDCDIAGNTSVGVEIREESEATLRKCRLRDWNSGGILVHRAGKAILEGCSIAGNYGAGVTTHGGGKATLRRCAIHDNVEAGVLAKSYGAAELKDCEVLANGHAGVKVQWRGGVTLGKCKVSRNKQAGVEVGNNGVATVEKCDLTDNIKGPWSLAGAAKVERNNNDE